MKNLLSKLILLSVTAASLSVANAEIVYSEDFEEYTPGTIVGADTHANWFRTSTTNDHFFEARTDSSHIFSQGENQFGYMADTSPNNGSINIFNASSRFSKGITSGQLTFEFYDPSSAPHANNGYLLRIGNASGNSGTAFGIFIRNGSLILAETNNVNIGTNIFGSYQMDQVNRIDVIFNNTGTTLAYQGGSVLARSMNVYINGTLLGENLGTAGSLGQDVNITHFDFTAKVFTNPNTDFMGTLYLDNITVSSTAAIPEAGTYALALAALMVTALAFRRIQRG